MVARTSRITGRLVSFHRLLNLPPKTVETPDLRTDLVYRLRIVVTDADDALRQGMPVTVQFGDEAGHE
ncbi:HlyD-family secretion protein [Escherichia coli]|uniref:HlyD-family secretion protein n=1 Tax=Escherichia coli TaxID=562 RepID=A0A377DKI2_ECOLX|nr:HlyD-family secretion protein [Escherichia coli]